MVKVKIEQTTVSPGDVVEVPSIESLVAIEAFSRTQASLWWVEPVEDEEVERERVRT